MVRKAVYIGVVGVGLYLIISLTSSIVNLWKRQEEVTIARNELEKLQKENKDLKTQFAYTQGREFVERQAREKLGLVLEGEKQVIIDEGLLKATESAKLKDQRPNWLRWWELFL